MKQFLLTLLAFPALIFSQEIDPYRYNANGLTKDSTMAAPVQQNVFITTGFVWIRDKSLKSVYGGGIANLITLDSFWHWGNNGIGAKVSYLREDAKVANENEAKRLFEIPAIVYVRKQFGKGLQPYISLGAGILYTRQIGFIGGNQSVVGGIDAEVGLNFSLFDNLFISTALDYLWFQKRGAELNETVQLGGIGLRAGLGFGF